MYSASNGWTPQQYTQIIDNARKLYNLLPQVSKTLSLEEFQLLTVFTLFSEVITPAIQSTEQAFSEFIINLNQYFEENNLAIQNPSGGASYISIQTAVSPYCKGIQFWNKSHDNTIVTHFGTCIAFDDLSEVNSDMFLNIAPLNAFSDPCVILAGTPYAGICTNALFVDVSHSNAQISRVYYFNLLPADYTNIYLQVKYSLSEQGYAERQSEISNYIYDRFQEINTIGKDFEPFDYKNGEKFEWLKDLEILCKIEGEASYPVDEIVRECGFMRKFKLLKENIEMVEII